MRVDPFYVQSLAVAVDQSTATENTLTSELSSGLKVQSLQDNPVAVGSATTMGSAISRDDSYVQLASSVQTQMQVADSALGEVVSQVTSALSLAVQGSNGTLNGSNLQTVAQQLMGFRDQVLSLANTSYQGSYVFGGSQGKAAPFALDTTVSPAVASYSGDSKVQTVATPGGQKIQVNLPGSTVFGSGATGVLGALNQLIADFAGGSVSSSVGGDTASLSTALSTLSQKRTVLDSSLSRLQATNTYAQTDESQLKAAQSGLVAADTVSVATALKSEETQHQALISTMSALGSVNLFSYMK